MSDSESVKRSPGCVLLVDDDTTILGLLAELLESEGYEVAPCSDVDRARRAIEAGRPDVVLVDLYLGDGQAGWELVDGLRSDPRTAAVPIIVCSAAALERDARWRRLRAGGTTLLTKPFDVEALLGAVAAAIGRGSASS